MSLLFPDSTQARKVSEGQCEQRMTKTVLRRFAPPLVSIGFANFVQTHSVRGEVISSDHVTVRELIKRKFRKRHTEEENIK